MLSIRNLCNDPSTYLFIRVITLVKLGKSKNKTTKKYEHVSYY